MEAYENRSPLQLWVEGLSGEMQSFTRTRLPRPVRRVCIFGQGRSGSTLLVTLLDSHPGIRCEDELLRRPRLRPFSYIDRVSRGRAPAFGFHLKPYHLTRHQRVTDIGSFMRRLVADGWHIIHLTRHDVIAHAFSNAYAAQHGWHHRADKGEHVVKPIEIDPEGFVRRVRKRQMWHAREREALQGLETFPLSYEDDLKDAERRAIRLGDLQDWLGVERSSLATPLRKAVPRSHWDLMSNADAVRLSLEKAGIAFE